MVKPGLAYLTSPSTAPRKTERPIAAYKRSAAKYAMGSGGPSGAGSMASRSASKPCSLLQSAGADLILTYHACDAAAGLRDGLRPVSPPGKGQARRPEWSTQTKNRCVPATGHVPCGWRKHAPRHGLLSCPRAPVPPGKPTLTTSNPRKRANGRRPARQNLHRSRLHFAASLHFSTACLSELNSTIAAAPATSVRRRCMTRDGHGLSSILQDPEGNWLVDCCYRARPPIAPTNLAFKQMLLTQAGVRSGPA